MILMMSKGRVGSAVQKTGITNKVIINLVFLLGLVLCMVYVDAEATYVVGDNTGWNSGVLLWPLGKTFRAGDVLVFNYNPLINDVAVVTRVAYATCVASPCAKVYKTGNDSIKLEKGPNYFISTFPGQCRYAQVKLAVVAE